MRAMNLKISLYCVLMMIIPILPSAIEGQEGSHQKQIERESESLEIISSILVEHHATALMEYRCVCVDHAMFGLQAPLRKDISQNMDTVQALQHVLVNNLHLRAQNDGSGLIVILDRRISQAVLAIRIHQVVLNENEQYNPDAAIEKALDSPEVHKYFDEHNIETATRLSELIAVPQKALPHLDPEMNDMTVLDVIKCILQKFPQLAVYRECVDRSGHSVMSIDFH